ncbi:pyridoxal-5'-phosphate-dependent protein [Actinoplanes sp. SE50]|uniref:DegT/DnrJ/EryC1/StrS family aminotransferase n=1 Tax=unclassified Actinoplanes TaxID=2626549 RepID=UPI00023EC698|nr:MULTISPECIES: aminotransferase class I/II-fold pyridoxal phosphate-dependent enzyme [unclassified Actinoplanes]AEV86433.1 DegT/DnrJ/EryC1/StrS aminotransferase [Actinoplanes sp. SE50/110]ATO84831.1 pyridoxal-5'-phosphate-dependent protein [Actinoplanes sp. SE50]SLM02241.1 pyridoxal-5'-phosphate-dependent protein [Actinoplanes sp. SE50/110]
MLTDEHTVLLSPPDVGDLELEYVTAALRSGWIAPAGPDLDRFEAEIADRVGVPHAVALTSGTAALHLALLGLGAGPGDVVVVPTLTFVATANAVAYTGATPVFADCDPDTGNLDPDLLDALLTELRAEGARVRAVMTVDLFGSCADYDRIGPLCDRLGIPVVEDAAEALGATRAGRAAGSFGRVAALSFNGNKVLTTSGGGMLLTADGGLAERARHLAGQARLPVTHYEHAEIGYSYRLSNILAALGRAQLRRLDEMVERRRALHDAYAKIFSDVDGVTLPADADPGSNRWLTSIVVDPERAGWQAAELAAHLAARRVETRPVFKPMHLQPLFAGARAALTGAAERLFRNGLLLPSGSALRDDQVRRVLDEIADYMGDRR